jgi:hypothetical protein
VKKLIALGASAVGAAGVSMALFGSGVAYADDYAGMSYDDASSAASDAGQTVTIASRLGSLPDSDCVVERSQAGSFIDGADFTSKRTGEVEFYLNCNGAVASAGKPGNSAASEAGRAELARQAEEAAKAQQDQADELLQAGAEPGAPTPDVPTG